MTATLTDVDAGRRVSAEGRERELWKRLKRDRDQRAREELVEIYMPVARRMAGIYQKVTARAAEKVSGVTP